MTKRDHLAKAKDYIAKGEDYYRKAAEEIVAAHDEGWAWAAIGRELRRDESWVRKIVAWANNPGGPARPFGGERENEARYERHVKQTLRDPERRKQAIAQLPPEHVEDLIEDANEVAVDRARAKRQEQSTGSKPTTRDLMGDDKFDPAEYWADKLIIRVNTNAHELASLIQRGGGLLLGAMAPEKAHEYLHEAEQLIAEARAAAQEQARDRVEV